MKIKSKHSQPHLISFTDKTGLQTTASPGDEPQSEEMDTESTPNHKNVNKIVEAAAKELNNKDADEKIRKFEIANETLKKALTKGRATLKNDELGGRNPIYILQEKDVGRNVSKNHN